MAHCIAVTENAIRVQLPGGELYAPALREAASKVGARSGLTKRRATAFNTMVIASVDLLNNGNASTITLEMWVHDDSLEAKVVGKGSKTTKKAAAKLRALGEKHAQSFSGKAFKSGYTIRFDV